MHVKITLIPTADGEANAARISAATILRKMPDATLKLLFVCVENSNRSQMAEAFARLHGRERVEARSAGSRPSGVINPRAVAAMKQKGVDLLVSQRSKGLDELPKLEWDYVITMGCGDACPHLPARHREDWALEDPKHLPPEQFKRVRDEIERRVINLLERNRQ
jgi:arsenate reductase